MNSRRALIGLMIIVLGVLLLLVNLGYMNFSVLWRIWNIWPLLLVVIGVNILFKGKPMVSSISWIIFFLMVIFYGVYLQNTYSTMERIPERVEESIQLEMDKTAEVQYGHLNLDIGAARLTMNQEDTNLLVANLNGRSLNYKEDYKNNNQTALITFESSSFRGINIGKTDLSNYDFYLNKDIIWDIDLNLGAISGEINLKDIPVQSIDLDFGAGDLDIILGNALPELYFDIDAGASNINITIPKEAGIKAKMDTALTTTNIDTLGLKKEGDYYISGDYQDAETKIEFDIDMGVGRINFIRQ